MTTSTLPLDFPVPTRRTNQVYIASTEPDLAKVQAIWEEVYKEELGWLDETNTDPRNDRFHASSVYLLATGSEGEPVGVMRMVITVRRDCRWKTSSTSRHCATPRKGRWSSARD